METTDAELTRKWGRFFAWLFLFGTFVCFVSALGAMFIEYSRAATLFFITFALLMSTIFLFIRTKASSQTSEPQLTDGQEEPASNDSRWRNPAAKLILLAAGLGALISLFVFLDSMRYTGSGSIGAILHLMILLISVPITLALALIGLVMNANKD